MIRRCAAALSLLGFSCLEAPAPFPQAILAVDTDLPVPALASRLRVDIYDGRGTWRETRDFSLRSAADFPASLAVYLPDPQRSADVYVRLRMRPDNAERDYRGERYVDPVSSTAPPASRPSESPPTEGPRLVFDGEDRTPLTEPLPSLTVDRLVRVTLTPGANLRRRVTLRASCLGQMSDLAARQTCIDSEKVLVPADDGDGPDDGRPSAAGSTVTPLSESLPEREGTVRLQGGAFLLGGRALTQITSESNVTSVSNVPPRPVIVSPFSIDGDEVSVARMRAVLGRGFRPPVPVVANPERLADSSTNPRASCTYISVPDPNDPERETLPVTCVPFDTARAFCKFEGGDLPSEAQWEYAATAAGRSEKSPYPWGTAAPTCEGVVFGRSDSSSLGDNSCHTLGFPFGLRGISSATQDTTPNGIRNLGGGVHEWIRGAPLPYDSACYRMASLVDPECNASSRYRALRGGSPMTNAYGLVSVIRWRFPEGGSSPIIGFRCVYVE
jgi:formylglycine-generating enzyme required for sulfatase activity